MNTNHHGKVKRLGRKRRAAGWTLLGLGMLVGACACPPREAEPPQPVMNAPPPVSLPSQPPPVPPVLPTPVPPEHEVYTFWTLSDKVSFSIVLVVMRGAGETVGSGTFTAFGLPEAKSWGIVDAREDGPRAWSFTADMLDGKHRWSFSLPATFTPGAIGLIELTSDRAGAVEFWCSYGRE